MRIDTPRDLGHYVRERRRSLKLTQEALAQRVGVSRRWLSALESGKASAEFGLVLRLLRSLELIFDARPIETLEGRIDLDEHLRKYLGGRP